MPETKITVTTPASDDGNRPNARRPSSYVDCGRAPLAMSRVLGSVRSNSLMMSGSESMLGGSIPNRAFMVRA